MPTPIDIDLDALAPPNKRVKLAGKVWQLPGDMPMELFIRTQGYEARVSAGEDEAQMLVELKDEILALFKVNHPELKELPQIGLVQLLRSLGQIYGGQTGEAPAANRATRRARTRTPSSKKPAKAASSR